MPRFQQVSEGHVTAATEILVNLREDVYAPLNPVTLCPVCSGLAALLKTLRQRTLTEPEETIDARDAAGTCIVMSEILKQIQDMMANVEDLVRRENRAKLLEVDLVIGSLQGLAISSQNKMELLVKSLATFYADETSLKSNWSEFVTWLCGVLLSYYCIQKPKIWHKLTKSSNSSFNLASFMVSPEKEKSVSFSVVEDQSAPDEHELALKLIRSTLMEEMLGFSDHLTKVQRQLTEISSVIKKCGLSHFPTPVPY